MLRTLFLPLNNTLIHTVCCLKMELKTIDQCKQEAKKAEKNALPNFGRQKGRLGSVWR